MSSNRTPIRALLASLIQSALNATELTVVVYPYRKSYLVGQLLTVTITSAGSDRENMTFEGDGGVFAIDVHVFAQYADPTVQWTEQDADDAADLIEATVASVVANSQENGIWNVIRYRERSESQSRPLRNTEYRYERIPLEISVFS